MRKLSLFIAVFFSVFLINIGVSRSHVEPEDPSGGPFIECEELNLSGGVGEEYGAPLVGEVDFRPDQCGIASFPREGEEAEFDQVEFEDIELLDIFVNFNDAVLEADKPEATNELEEWVETINTVVNEGGSLEAEVDVKLLHNAQGGNPNGAQGNEHHKVFDSCETIF